MTAVLRIKLVAGAASLSDAFNNSVMPFGHVNVKRWHLCVIVGIYVSLVGAMLD